MTESHHAADYLIRGMLKNKNIRFSLTETTNLVTAGIFTHNLDPVSALLFGRCLTTASLLTPLLEKQEIYTIKWNYQGKLSSVIVDTTASAHVRGIISDHSLMEKINTEDDVYGEGGKLSITKSAEGKILNSGVIDTTLMDVVDDVAFFFCTSDQIETELIASIKFNNNPSQPVTAAAGLMLQAMPSCDLETFSTIRSRLQAPDCEKMLLSTNIQEEKKLWQLLEYVFDQPLSELKSQEALSYQFSHSPSYHCSCSGERMRRAVKVLDDQELQEILTEQGQVSISCQFCNTKYSFTEEELTKQG